MGGIFAKPRVVTAPAVPPPPPIPEVDEEGVRPRRRRRGRAETFITGELEPETLGKKRLLG